MSDFFAKKVVNDFLHRQPMLFCRKYNSLRPVIAARCTPLHLIAHHCKLGEIFLLKTLKHTKIPKVESIFRDLFVYFCRNFCRYLWALASVSVH